MLPGVLVDGGPEGVVDVAETVPEDVAEPDQHRQPDAAELQVVGELLQVDRARRVLGRMDEDVAVTRNGKVALPPAVHFVQLGRVADGENLARLKGAGPR